MFKAESFNMEFSCGLFYCFFGGFCWKPQGFFEFEFASIQSACSLEILSTQNPPQLLPPWNCRSSQKFTDLN